MTDAIRKALGKQVPIAPLVTLRVLFGLMMVLGTLRFLLKGWVRELYIEPEFHFTYIGFEFVRPWGEVGTYVLFAIVGLSALGICFGLFYRISTVLFFLSFSYVELLDKTTYLNHYYFVSIIAFLLIWMPAHRRWSMDVSLWPSIARTHMPAWCLWTFRAQVGIVYIFAGAAKLQPDWMLRAMPLAIWLPQKAETVLIGPLLRYKATAYLFSWFGAFYDLFVTFFLLWKPSRWLAFATVVIFHLMTALLFPIGIFPYVMIVAATVFFSPEAHQRMWVSLSQRIDESRPLPSDVTLSFPRQTIILSILTVHFIVQLLLPLRFMLYPGNVLWTEQGFRFSWRVMLIEKVGYIAFHIKDADGREFISLPEDYLTPLQVKMMSTQPDMVLQYAHFLEGVFLNKGVKSPEVRAEGMVSLNGHVAQSLIDPTRDLTKEMQGWSHWDWVMPFQPKEGEMGLNLLPAP